MFDETSTRAARPTHRANGALHAYQVFFAVHCLGFVALLVARDGERGARAILDLFAIGDGATPFAGGEWGWLGAPWQVVTYIFLHQSPLEFAASVLLLLTVGSEVERLLGPARFSAVYLGSGAAIAAAHQTLLGFEAPVPGLVFVGGLGAGAGLLSAHVLLQPQRKAFGFLPAPGLFLASAGLLLGTILYLEQEPARRLVELLQSPLASEQWYDRQYELGAHPAASLPHTFGLLAGGVAFSVDAALARLISQARVRRQIRVLERELEARDRVEALLEKISREGLDALSRRERQFLEYASRFYPQNTRVS